MMKSTTISKATELAKKMRKGKLPWIKHEEGGIRIRLKSSLRGTIRLVKSQIVGDVISLPEVGDELEEGDIIAVLHMLNIKDGEHIPFKARVLEVHATSGMYIEYGTLLLTIEVFCESDEALAEIEKELSSRHHNVFFHDPAKDRIEPPRHFVPTLSLLTAKTNPLRA